MNAIVCSSCVEILLLVGHHRTCNHTIPLMSLHMIAITTQNNKMRTSTIMKTMIEEHRTITIIKKTMDSQREAGKFMKGTYMKKK